MLLIATFVALLIVFLIAGFCGSRARIPITILYGTAVLAAFALPFISSEPLAGVWAIVLTLPSSLVFLVLIIMIGISNSIIIAIGIVAGAVLNGYLLWRVAGLASR